MPPPLLPENHPPVPPGEFDKFLRDFLRNGDIPDETRELAQTLQMQLATPGDWAEAEHRPPDSPDS